VAILSRSHRRSIYRLGLIAVLCAAAVGSAIGQIDEYQVKAAFIFNFAKFIEWPTRSFPKPGDPIVICILGQNPFDDHLTGAIQGKIWNGRGFAVLQIVDLPSKSRCQILFVTSSERQHFRSLAGSLKGSGILTVGETPGFIDDGGIINLKLEGGKIRFEINVDAAEQSQLIVSSKLLSLAQIIKK
jgi:YfiR/HmsC-like